MSERPMLEWYEAQLEADERIARAAIPDEGSGDWRQLHHCPHDEGDTVPPSHDLCARIGLWGDELFISDEGGHSPEQARHIAMHDPTAVLVDIASKRAILAIHALEFSHTHEDVRNGRAASRAICAMCEDGHTYPLDWPCLTVRALVSAFAHRPGYLPEWAPT